MENKEVESEEVYLIPKENFQAVYSWLGSGRMTLPYNEVKQALILLETARPANVAPNNGDSNDLEDGIAQKEDNT